MAIIISNQKEKGDFYEESFFIIGTLGTSCMGSL
jgi:hypothetical protein